MTLLFLVNCGWCRVRSFEGAGSLAYAQVRFHGCVKRVARVCNHLSSAKWARAYKHFTFHFPGPSSSISLAQTEVNEVYRLSFDVNEHKSRKGRHPLNRQVTEIRRDPRRPVVFGIDHSKGHSSCLAHLSVILFNDMNHVLKGLVALRDFDRSQGSAVLAHPGQFHPDSLTEVETC